MIKEIIDQPVFSLKFLKHERLLCKQLETYFEFILCGNCETLLTDVSKTFDCLP